MTTPSENETTINDIKNAEQSIVLQLEEIRRKYRGLRRHLRMLEEQQKERDEKLDLIISGDGNGKKGLVRRMDNTEVMLVGLNKAIEKMAESRVWMQRAVYTAALSM